MGVQAVYANWRNIRQELSGIPAFSTNNNIKLNLQDNLASMNLKSSQLNNDLGGELDTSVLNNMKSYIPRNNSLIEGMEAVNDAGTALLERIGRNIDIKI